MSGWWALAIFLLLAGSGPAISLLRALTVDLRRLRALERRIREHPELLERPLTVGVFSFDRKSLIRGYLRRGGSLDQMESLLGDGPFELRPLLDGPDGFYTQRSQPRENYSAKWLLSFRCLACRDEMQPADALIVVRDPARVRAFCTQGHEVPGGETRFRIN